MYVSTGSSISEESRPWTKLLYVYLVNKQVKRMKPCAFIEKFQPNLANIRLNKLISTLIVS